MHPAGPGRFLSFGIQAILAAAAGITGVNTILARTLVVGLILLGGMSMAPAAGDRDATRGRELYARYCTGCHGVDGRGEAKTFRPNVGNLAVKEYLDQVSDEYLFAAIKQGGVAVGKNAAMPAWDKQLDDGQIWDVVAFVRTLGRR
jgi:mono/diheme cytochrome c family protein